MINNTKINLSLDSSLPVNVEGIYDCFDSALHAVFKYLGWSYELLFFDSWKFDFNYNNFLSNKSLNINIVDIGERRWDYLKKYHGINFDVIRTKNLCDIKERIQKQLELRIPVLATIELYYCSWHHDYYQKNYGLHEVIIVGITLTGYIIKDFQYACDGLEMSFEDFYQCVKKYRFVNKTDDIEQFNWAFKLSEMSNKLLSENLCGKILQLADALAIPGIIKKEIEEFTGPIYSAPFLEKISSISISREKTAASLEYIYQTYNVIGLDELINKAKDIAKTWKSVFGMMCKLFFIPNNRQEAMLTRICEKIRVLSKSEENFLHSLASGVYNQSKSEVDSLKMTCKEYGINNFNTLNLKRYYNTNGLSGELLYNCPSIFTSEKRYLYVTNNEFEKMSSVNGIPFMTSDLASDTNDHISCYGEIILFEPDYYDYFYILCNADLEDQMENLSVLYIDNTFIDVPLSITSWLNRPSFNEDIAISCNGVVRNDEEKCVNTYPFEGYIFIQKIKIDNSKKCCGLKLPICPNMHIFAITIVN